MCGIWAYIQLTLTQPNYHKLYKDFMALKPRGPDMSSFQTIKNLTVGFHRLAIMDPTFHANQPYIIEDGERTIVFICNGEIYNFKDLIRDHQLPITTNADCLTIPRLYIKYVKNNPDGRTHLSQFSQLFTHDVKGEYAFILFEFDKLQNLKQVVAGRDQLGVRPLYWHQPHGTSNAIIFSSEMKGMCHFEDQVDEFPPGTIAEVNFDNLGTITSTDTYNFKVIYNITPNSIESAFSEDEYLRNVRNAVINSVKRRLTSDKPISFLLSGGLDSSLVTAISAKLLGVHINTYCCGMNEGTDLIFARKVAKHIGSHHTEVFFTPEEGCDAIRDVIRTIESYDTTSVRASIPQYLVSKYIGTKTDCKVLCTGEGSDELTSGYIFNYYAPSGQALHDCSVEYMQNIHMYDGRRCDRCVAHWSLEARIPLLDPEVVTAYWAIPSEYRMPTYKNCEKWWLRQAFEGTDILPSEVLWRRKEAFSDGVSGERSWFQIIQDYIDTQVSDVEFRTENKWGCVTKESYYYKRIFVEYFGEKRLSILPGYWLPKWTIGGQKVTQYMDPSARVLSVYK